jgi:hypothetical protein
MKTTLPRTNERAAEICRARHMRYVQPLSKANTLTGRVKRGFKVRMLGIPHELWFFQSVGNF